MAKREWRSVNGESWVQKVAKETKEAENCIGESHESANRQERNVSGELPEESPDHHRDFDRGDLRVRSHSR